jgi:hypothetical protein
MDAAAGDANAALQTPPQGAKAVEAWLAKGDYKAWHCEDAVHASRSPSPHGFNRICSNDLIADNASAETVWPKGAAAVKELYTSADADKPAGYSVYLKTADETDGGKNWYWYERLPAGDAEPSVVADGLGDSGGAKNICVSCHVAAGTDAAHTPTRGGHDQVYTAVP